MAEPLSVPPVVGVVRVAAGDCARLLRAAPDRGRGFLGLDPVTANDALLTRELVALGAVVFARGDALLGHVSGRGNPRLALVSTTSADPAVLAAHLRFLAGHRRITSFVGAVTADAACLPAFTGCGFRPVGRLRDHVFRGGRYHDVHVYHAARPTAGPGDRLAAGPTAGPSVDRPEGDA